MLIFKLIVKIFLLPVLLLLCLVRIAMNIAIHLYTCVGVWLWALLGVIALYSLIQQNWRDIGIVAIIGVASFAIVFVATWIMCMIEDAGSWIKKIICG